MKKSRILPVLILLGFLFVSLAYISLAIVAEDFASPEPQSSWPSTLNLIIGLVFLTIAIIVLIIISRKSKEPQEEITEDRTFDYCPGER